MRNTSQHWRCIKFILPVDGVWETHPVSFPSFFFFSQTGQTPVTYQSRGYSLWSTSLVAHKQRKVCTSTRCVKSPVPTILLILPGNPMDRNSRHRSKAWISRFQRWNRSSKLQIAARHHAFWHAARQISLSLCLVLSIFKTQTQLVP